MILKENEFNNTEKPALLHLKWNWENIIVIRVILIKKF